MSRIPSGGSAGVQVEAKPSSSIYTLLTIIALVFLVVAVAVVMVRADGRFGWVVPFGQKYDQSQAEHKRRMNEGDQAIRDAKDAMSRVSLKPAAAEQVQSASEPAAPVTE